MASLFATSSGAQTSLIFTIWVKALKGSKCKAAPIPDKVYQRRYADAGGLLGYRRPLRSFVYT